MEYGSEFDARANEGFLGGSGAFVREDWQLYRSGRDAMKALARLVGPRRVLLPALCCESMILPFASNGCELVFYRLRADLRGDEDDVRAKAGPGALLLYLPYFGVRPFSYAFLESLRGKNVLLAEDRTQDILTPRGPGGFAPDATLASLRKWAAMPEGGMLCTALGQGEGEPDARFGALRDRAMEKKSRYLACWDPALKREFLAALNAASDLLDESGAPVCMGADARRRLAQIDFAAVYAARVRNVRLLRDALSPLRESGKLRFLTERPEASALYFPIRLPQRDAAQKAMASRGVYCPVIWPEPPGAEGVCPVSRGVVDDMLAIPCDQRYGEDDMAFIAASLREILE